MPTPPKATQSCGEALRVPAPMWTSSCWPRPFRRLGGRSAPLGCVPGWATPAMSSGAITQTAYPRSTYSLPIAGRSDIRRSRVSWPARRTVTERCPSRRDRLLIFAADALAGRPVAGLAGRARALLEDPSIPARLEAVAAEEGLMALAALISEPDRLVAKARRGRLTYGTAARTAVRSPAARAALRSRLASRLGLRPRGLLVALSGMDGARKVNARRRGGDGARGGGSPCHHRVGPLRAGGGHPRRTGGTREATHSPSRHGR